MRILRLLNKKYLSIIFILLSTSGYTEEKPVDIWNIDKKNIEENTIDINVNEETNPTEEKITESSIYNTQTQKQVETIKLESNLNSNEVKLLGLYDPEEYDLDINMWINSDGDQLKNI